MAIQEHNTSRSGARRSGDDYQDLIAIEVMLEFLENPQSFSAVAFEVAEKGSLDDVVRYSADGQHTDLYQVKYTLHPNDENDEYTWDRLLFRAAGKNRLLPSLLSRWISSFIKCYNEGHVTACLKTNRHFNILIDAIHDKSSKLISYESIPTDVIAKSKEESFSIEEIKLFFDNFKFDVNYLSFDVLQASLISKLNRLGCNENAFYFLSQKLHQWIRSGTTRIDLQQIRAACNWHQLNSFDENFLIPQDYVVPDDDFLKEIKKILASDAKCVLISASPGAGKSSFISYLKNIWENDIFIRHHYFLSIDRNIASRFDHREIIESLMHDIGTSWPESIQTISNRNPSVRDFRNLYETVAAYCIKENKKLIVAIDGLDHVWRNRASNSELDCLLQQLFPVPNGAIIILGSQPLSGEREPLIFQNFRSDIIHKELPLFNRQAIDAWLKKNESLISKTSSVANINGEYNKFIEKLLNISSGHPLVLRYIVQGALNASPNDISIYTLNRQIQNFLGNIPRDIENYYSFIRGKCSSCSIFLLKCVCFSQWSWKYEDLISLAIQNNYSHEAAESGWNEVRHLFKNVRDEWQFIHESFLLHLQKEYKLENEKFNKILMIWLGSFGNQYLKWRYFAEYSKTLNNTDKEWCINALLIGYSIDDITHLIARDAAIDLRSHNFRNFASKSLWLEYFSNRYNFYDVSSIEEIWTESQFLLGLDKQLPELLQANKARLSNEQLHILINYAEKNDKRKLIDEFIDRIEIKNKSRCRHDELNNLYDILFDIWGNEAWNVDKWIDNFNNSKNLALKCAKALWKYNNTVTIRNMLSNDKLNDSSRETLSEYLTLLSIENDFDLSTIQGYVSNVYSSLVANESIKLSAPATEIPESAYEENNWMTKQWLSQTLFYIVWASSNNLCELNDFINNLSGSFWVKGLFTQIADLFAQKKFTYQSIISDAITVFNHIENADIDKVQDRNIWQCLFSCWPIFLIKLKILLSQNEEERIFSVDELKLIIKVKFCNAENFLEELLSCKRDIYLSDEACKFLAETILNIPCDCFGEQGSRPSRVALMWARRGDIARAKEALYRSIDLFYSYGWHKDGLFYWYIKAGDVFQSKDIPELYGNLIKASYYIGDYTDEGDFSEAMSELLAEKYPSASLAFYYFLLTNNSYREAEHIFNDFCLQLPQSAEIERGVIRSNISVNFLHKISLDKNKSRYGFILEDSSYIYKGIEPRQYRNSNHEFSTSTREVLVEDYAPERFSEFVKNIDGVHLITREKLTQWCDYWEKQNSALVVLEALQKFVDERNYSSSEFKFKIFEYEKRINGKDKAWPYLVSYFVDIQGWHDYYTSFGFAKEVWDIIKSKYPRKYLDFIYETMLSKSSANTLTMWGCSKRLSQYLVFMNRYELALDIMRGTKDALIRLMSPLGVEISDLPVNDITDDLLIDLLISRLEFPSSLVREQTCKELTSLLETEYQQKITKKLCYFVENHALDSIAQIGLFPFILYKKEKKKLPCNFMIKMGKVCSITLAHLLNYLSESNHYKPSIIENAPVDYVNKEFLKLVRHVLPPFYQETGMLIEKQHPGFMRQWSYEFDNLGFSDALNCVGANYYGREDDEHLVIMDTILSEKMRSAYLYALAWVSQVDTASFDISEYLSLRTLPIDFGLWQLKSHKPYLIFTEDKLTDRNQTESLRKIIEQLILENTKESQQLLCFASGRLQTQSEIYELEICGFLHGLSNMIDENAQIIFDNLKYCFVASDTSNAIDIEKATFEIIKQNDSYKDALPLFARLQLTPIIRWQYWRAQRGMTVPIPFASNNPYFSAKVNNDIIEFYGNHEKIGNYYDWNMGISERVIGNIPAQTGCATFIDVENIKELLSQGYHYCIVYKLTHHINENHLEKLTQENTYGIIATDL